MTESEEGDGPIAVEPKIVETEPTDLDSDSTTAAQKLDQDKTVSPEETASSPLDRENNSSEDVDDFIAAYGNSDADSSASPALSGTASALDSSDKEPVDVDDHLTEETDTISKKENGESDPPNTTAETIKQPEVDSIVPEEEEAEEEDSDFEGLLDKLVSKADTGKSQPPVTKDEIEDRSITSENVSETPQGNEKPEVLPISASSEYKETELPTSGGAKEENQTHLEGSRSAHKIVKPDEQDALAEDETLVDIVRSKEDETELSKDISETVTSSSAKDDDEALIDETQGQTSNDIESLDKEKESLSESEVSDETFNKKAPATESSGTTFDAESSSEKSESELDAASVKRDGPTTEKAATADLAENNLHTATKAEADDTSTDITSDIHEQDIAVVKREVEKIADTIDSADDKKDTASRELDDLTSTTELKNSTKEASSDEESEESSEEDSSESSDSEDDSDDDDSSSEEDDSEEDSSSDDDDEEAEDDSSDEDEEFVQPEIFIYTSFSSAMMNMVSHTNRMALILQAHKIKFTYIDVATDERAKRLWKWKGQAKGKVLPVVVREGEILCDLPELEEFSESHEVWDRIIEDEVL